MVSCQLRATDGLERVNSPQVHGPGRSRDKSENVHEFPSNRLLIKGLGGISRFRGCFIRAPGVVEHAMAADVPFAVVARVQHPGL